MPQIYELLGYPLSDLSESVIQSRKKIYCPFIGDVCDGGGNRFMSEIDLISHKELRDFFPNLAKVPSGICSIQVTDEDSPWIVCPRRLFYMGNKANDDILRGETQQKLLGKSDFAKGTHIGIWTEVKVKYADNISSDCNDIAAFDYTFDYVMMPLGIVKFSEAVIYSGLERNELKRLLQNNEYNFFDIDGEIFIKNFPVGNPLVVEVMTSSTSGGNKRKRSCIPQAFEDAILGRPHLAPGINYRQVWARMVSQLIVKSQAAIGWNGKTIWILQDLLANYISSSTALNLHNLVAEQTDEVNILAFSYGNNYKHLKKSHIVTLKDSVLYSGKIRNDSKHDLNPCFQDIILSAVCPPRSALISALVKKVIANKMIV